MRPEKQGLVLTRADEFTVIGQAMLKGSDVWIDSAAAAAGALEFLEQTDQYKPNKLEWQVPIEKCPAYAQAVVETRDRYAGWKGRYINDADDFPRPLSTDYYDIEELETTADRVARGLMKVAGVPGIVSKEAYMPDERGSRNQNMARNRFPY